MQDRAIALHHLDCPWRPADMAQREGRILRQGNLNGEVHILRYVTEKSFDGYLFQAVERKARFIAQVMRGRLDVREIEDIGDAALSFTEVKALATGNPLLMDKAEADAALTRLWRAERAWHRNQDALRFKITATASRTEALAGVIGEVDAAIARRRDTRGDAFTMTVDGVRHGKRHDAGARLKHQIQQQAGSIDAGGSSSSLAPVVHGHLGGFDVTGTVQRVLGAVQVTITLDSAPEAEIRLSPDELSDADPARLITRLENRLAGLEACKTRILSDIDRLNTEADRARQDLARPFPQARQLADARDRVKRIDEQLEEAARPPRPDDSPQPGAAAAAPGDANGQAPGQDTTDGQEPGRPGEQPPVAVAITRLDFPDGNPLPSREPATLPAATRPPQPPVTARPAR